ncbi:diguanylate cyclase [Thalassotalea fonticola]|uniref:diguanylate cyclase n=1 Tax=Thalassotalea fonticola TaxID=3065649 RepID=A0ABZ0GMM7_9GAMM|nr:diguanylate cyclase [Colwelliaceae bacterium S1-1]
MKKQLSLSSLSIVILVVLSICLLTISLGYRFFVEIPNEKLAVLKLQNRDLDRIISTTVHMGDALAQMNYGYAILEDTYNYITQPNDDYIDTNFSTNVFQNLEIDGAFILDTSGKTIFQKGLDHMTLKPLDFKQLLIEQKLIHAGLLKQASTTDKALVGTINTNVGLMVYALTAIYDSDITEQTNGFLLFLQRFDKNFVSELEEQVKIKLTILPYSDDFQDYPILSDEISNVTTIEQIKYRVLQDEMGIPSLVLRITHLNVYKETLLTKELLITLLIQLIIMLLIFWLIRIKVVKPLLQVNTAITNMNDKQNLIKLHHRSRIGEFHLLVKHFNHMVEIVNSQQQQLSELSLTDALTQIPNRLAFEKKFTQEWAHLQRNQTPFAIVMCDIDYFKKYNDSLGHLAGDDALVKVAQALTLSSRRINDMVARYGGEEFIILFSGIELAGLKMKLTEMIESIEMLEILHPDSSVSKSITISIGATLMTPPRKSTEKMNLVRAIGIADNALYQAKNNGRNQAKIVFDK